MKQCHYLWKHVSPGALSFPRGVHMSSIYRPVSITPVTPTPKESGKKSDSKKADDTLSKSLRLLVDNGVMKHSSCLGAFHFLPLGHRSLEKLIKLVDKHMATLENCHKIHMPTLTSTHLWKATGRLDECRPELMRLKDRHSKEYLLSPTHEEAVCDLVKNPPFSYRQLPQRLYQISDKFRDEHRPRFGLLRARQFLMKDLYTFDSTLEAAQNTYEAVNQVYQKLLDALELPWMQAKASTGSFGGLTSHEFHVSSEIGEDSVITCHSCKHSFNQDLLEEEAQISATGDGGKVASASPKCINCGSTSALSSGSSIEVAHSFLLGTKYTKPLDALFITESGQKIPMEMGCYGLGVTRLLGTAVEVKSSAEEIRWPLRLAPYLVSILPPKEGSKEEPFGKKIAEKMYSSLEKWLPGEVIYDDRTNQTIGKRLVDLKKLGIPYLIVCGKGINDSAGGPPRLEFHDLNSNSMQLLTEDDIIKHLIDVSNEKIKIKL